MKSYAYRERGKRTYGPCDNCGSKDNRCYYENGDEHCFGCWDHKNVARARNKRGKSMLPIRGIPQEAREALKDFPNLPPANAGQSYLKAKRHRGEFALVMTSDLKQDGKALVVPMYDRKGRLRNLLYIYPDGTKRLLSGVSTSGLFHRIGNGNTDRIWIVEGWATGESVHAATGDDVLVAFGCSNIRAVAAYAKTLGKKVAICGDRDKRAALLAEEIAGDIGGELFIPEFPDGVRGTDSNDLAHSLGIDELKKQIKNDTRPIPPPPDLIEVAAGLSHKEYQQDREAFAEALKISVKQLDREVQQRRQEFVFEDVDPWPEPVDGIELVENIRKIIARYVSLSDSAATAVSLWILMTYLIDEIYTAAILAVMSPELRCGKTTLFGVLKRLVFRSLEASNISPAAVFRTMEAYAPTLLIDEADSFLDKNEEIRGILNSGHTHDAAFVIRCVGDDNNPVQFSTWGAKALASIRKLPPTLQDRSIIIPMRRKLVEDTKRRLRRSKPGDAFDVLRRQIVRWVNDYGADLDKVRIRRVKGLNDRAFDNWLPLLQISKRIGGDWQDKAVDAALALAKQEDGQEDSKGVLLLQDLGKLFQDEGDKKLATAFILNELGKMDDRPWPEYKRDEPITDCQLATLLRPFGIKPKSIRIGNNKTVRGYKFINCKDAFARYRRKDDKKDRKNASETVS